MNHSVRLQIDRRLERTESPNTVDRAYAHFSFTATRIRHLSTKGCLVYPLLLVQLPSSLPNSVDSSRYFLFSMAVSVSTCSSLYRYLFAVNSKEKHIERAAGSEEIHRHFLQNGPPMLLKGVSRGDLQLRVAIIGGLLLGFNDLGPRDARKGVWDRLESQIVISCAGFCNM